MKATVTSTPAVCTLLENSSTFWVLLAVRPSNSVSNPMKLKYYSSVLLGTNMHTFCTHFSRVVRFRVLVPRNCLLSCLRSAPCDVCDLRSLGTELMCLPRQPSTGRQTGGLPALEVYLRSITYIFVATRLGLCSGDRFRRRLVNS